ncbi:MAG TPA: ABC transporter substrate-binding protein [Stellaceae bacterium]|jgi:ABC-type nitrate/sulfonate/bicarbonate transport system substrate-binding protein
MRSSVDAAHNHGILSEVALRQAPGRRLLATVFLAFVVNLAAASAETLKIGKPAPIDFNFAIPEIGTGAGIFAKHGLTLEVVFLGGSARLHQAMIANSIDIAMGAGTDFAFIAKGAPEKGIAAMCGPPSNFFIAVPNASPIKTVADLKGMRVSVSSVGSLSQWFVEQISRRQGWGDNGIVYVATGGSDATMAAFRSGNIDAAFTALEGGLQMEDAGFGHMIFSFADFVHPFLAHAIFATDDLIEKNPDAIRRFLAGWFETIAWAKSHKGLAIQYAQPVTHATPAQAAKIYDVEMPAFSDDGRFDPAAVKVVLDSLNDMKQIDHIPDAKTLYTEQYLPPK